MINLLGEYDCRVDAKGRMMLPNGLKKQMESLVHEGFVINRDTHEKCLVLYPKQEWDKVSKQLNKLNRFIRKNALFIRKFNNGATPVQLDGTGRLLIPKVLSTTAEIGKEIKVLGNGERIEIWSKEHYEAMLNSDEFDFSELAEEVMGGVNPEEENE
ncbi:division/cell wall cluster transcriptional repressor MraZ [bacterium SCSIO 12741]|nr:division/cell wall cluster transcriptional repressor MraZ [bacterium SCSIO 12741]